MQRAILILLLLATANVHAEGFYLASGLRYLKDPYYFDDKSATTIGHVEFGYDHSFTKRIEIDAQYRHESDPSNANENDFVANESFEITLRLRLGSQR